MLFSTSAIKNYVTYEPFYRDTFCKSLIYGLVNTIYFSTRIRGRY
jgi:hypothetical protein